MIFNSQIILSFSSPPSSQDEQPLIFVLKFSPWVSPPLLFFFFPPLFIETIALKTLNKSGI